jgi:hypothetical protein
MEISRISRRLPVISVLATLFALVFAQGAFAANASVETYGGAGGGTQAQISAGGPSSPGSPGTGSSGTTAGGLPFTGLDLAILAGGGVLLIGAGAAMAVVSRPSRVGQLSPDDRN